MNSTKKITFLILFSFLGIIHLAAQTAKPTKGCGPLTVKFTDPTGQGNFFFWDFKNGSTAIVKDLLTANPATTFDKAGIYKVEVRKGTLATDPLIGTVTIEVYDAPKLGLIAVPTGGCAPLTVKFTRKDTINPNIIVNQYGWDFGDGAVGTGSNSTHTYLSGGIYSVAVNVKTTVDGVLNNTCDVSRTYKDLIKVSEQPNVSIFASAELTKCEIPLVTSFNAITGNANVTYEWDFGNGKTSIFKDNAGVTYDKVGNYTVKLTVKDNAGCSTTLQKVVSVGKPKASFIIPDTVCIKTLYDIINTSASGSYTWDFGTDAQFQTSNQETPSVTYLKSGLKSIKLTVTDNTGVCSSDTIIKVFVEDPIPDFTTAGPPSCQGKVVVNYKTLVPYKIYTWRFVSDREDTTSVPSPTFTWSNDDPSGYSPIGPFLGKVVLSVVTNAGCLGDVAKKIEYNFINARFVPDKHDGCAPLKVTFADSSYSKEPFTTFTYLWGDGSAPEVFNTKAKQTHTFTNPGEYKVRLIAKNNKGCVDTSYAVVIKVGTTLNPNFSVDKTSVCPGDTVKFKDLTNSALIDAWHYATENNQSWHCYDKANPIWAFTTQTGAQDVKLTVGYNGCFSSTTKAGLITVKGPIAKIDYKMQCAPKSHEVQFNSLSQAATAVSWVFSDTTVSNFPNPLHIFKQNKDYKAKLIAINPSSGCKASVDSIIVHVRDLNADFSIGEKLCLGTEYTLDSKSSKDVWKSCHRGYTWIFSDPGERPITTEIDSVPKFTYKIPGDYTVKLAVQDINGCRDTLERKTRIYGVYPDVALDKHKICLPNSVIFNASTTKADTTIKTIKWTFGDGMELDTKTLNAFPHLYDTQPLATPFKIKVVFTDEVGCGGVFTDTVGIYKPKSYIQVTSKSSVCLGESVSFLASDDNTGGSSLSYKWEFGDGKTATTQNPSYTYKTAKDYTVKLTATEIGTNCDAVIAPSVLTINIQAYPKADFTTDKSIVCVGSQNSTINFTSASTPGSTNAPLVTYKWDFGNGTSILNPAVATYNTKGEYTVILIAKTSAGCADTTSKKIQAVKPEGILTIDKSLICRGETITFTLKDTSSVDSWSWDFGDGKVVQGGLVVKNAYENRSVLLSNTTTARVILKKGTCETSIPTIITIRKVIAEITAEDTVCIDKMLTVSSEKSQGASSYTWDFGDKSAKVTTSTATHGFAIVDTFRVKLAILNNEWKCQDSTFKTIRVADIVLDGEPKFPNVFLPDGDASDNKIFKGIASAIDSIMVSKAKCPRKGELLTFRVFNRWGQKVYDDAVDGKTGWNGQEHNSGGQSASDVYIYYAEFMIGNKKVTKRGDVTLIR